MTSMLEKPTTNKAQRFNFSRTQDHGSAAEHAGRLKKSEHSYEDDPFFEEMKRQSEKKADKAHLNEIIREGLAGDKATDAEIYHEVQAASRQNHSDMFVNEFEGRLTREDRDYDAESEAIKLELDRLYSRVKEIVGELNELPRKAEYAVDQRSLDSQIDELEGELDETKEEIDELESNMPTPTVAEYDQITQREIDNSKARTATHDASFSEDDLGDYSGDSHIRISNSPR